MLGTFSTFHAQSFPAESKFCIYYAVTDGIGPTKFRLRVVDSALGSEANEIFFIETEPVMIQSPLVVLETVASIGLKFESQGVYHCELYANDKPLMSRRLLVATLPTVGDEGLKNG
ncbi:MAG: hypothetical protein K8T91_06245 [Planctomycetes bacterium]|nr:hypothetical protein [Planctomycetota bacterium]